MKKIAICLFIFALLLGVGVPGWALELKNAQAGYSLPLLCDWSKMDTEQMQKSTQNIILPILSAEQRRAMIASTQGAVNNRLTIFVTPVPLAYTGFNEQTAREIKQDLANNAQRLIAATEGNLARQPDYKRYSQQIFVDGYLLEYSAVFNNTTVQQVLSVRFTKDYMVLLVGQYSGDNNPAYSKTLLEAISGLKIDAAHKF